MTLLGGLRRARGRSAPSISCPWPFTNTSSQSSLTPSNWPSNWWIGDLGWSSTSATDFLVVLVMVEVEMFTRDILGAEVITT